MIIIHIKKLAISTSGCSDISKSIVAATKSKESSQKHPNL
jgi:hypothetical protein